THTHSGVFCPIPDCSPVRPHKTSSPMTYPLPLSLSLSLPLPLSLSLSVSGVCSLTLTFTNTHADTQAEQSGVSFWTTQIPRELFSNTHVDSSLFSSHLVTSPSLLCSLFPTSPSLS